MAHYCGHHSSLIVITNFAPSFSPTWTSSIPRRNVASVSRAPFDRGLRCFFKGNVEKRLPGRVGSNKMPGFRVGGNTGGFKQLIYRKCFFSDFVLDISTFRVKHEPVAWCTWVFAEVYSDLILSSLTDGEEVNIGNICMFNSRKGYPHKICFSIAINYSEV